MAGTKANIVHVLTLLILCTTLRAETERDAITTTDLLRLKSINGITVAEDGSCAVYAVRSISPSKTEQDQQEYEYRSHLFYLDLLQDEPQPRQLTFGAKNDHSPTISQDGRYLAFVRRDFTEPGSRQQAWIMPMDGGEASEVTQLPHGAAHPIWSPNGRRLLITSGIPFNDLEGEPAWPTERPERQWQDDTIPPENSASPDGDEQEIRAWLAQHAAKGNPFVITNLDFQDEGALRKQRRFKHLFLIDPHDPSVEPIQLTQDYYDHNDPAFMPDGRHIVYSAKKPTEIHPDRTYEHALWQITIDGSEDQPLLQQPGWTFTQPRPSRDGTVIAFTGRPIDDPEYRIKQVGIAAINGNGASDPVWLTGEDIFDSYIWKIRWLPTQSALLFTALREGGVPIMLTSPGLLEPTNFVSELDSQPVFTMDYAVGGGAVVYAAGSDRNPCVLRIRDAGGDRLLVDLNPWIINRTISRPKEGWLTRPDGTRIQYWILEPTELEEGKTYPLIVQIHGGPQWMWGSAAPSMWHEFQLMCNRGYGVVYCNPRGSSGYGSDFLRATFQDWGHGPAGDVLAVVDQVMFDDWVDRDRLFVTGGSYGGYLATWIIAHDHRFKAAVSQRGVYDMATFFGEGHQWRMVTDMEGGFPWEARMRTVMQRESPFLNVQRIRTPLMILHSLNDFRVGVSQALMMYRALKALNRPVELVLYPDADHNLSRRGDPEQRMDRLNRIIEFFDRYATEATTGN